MTSSLAAQLGHLARPGRSGHDDVRLTLVDALLVANGAGELTHDRWESAFADAMRSLRMRVIGDAESALRAAATQSRYPARRLRARLPDALAADILLNRLLATAIPLERLDVLATDPQSQRLRAAAADAAWEQAVAVAAAQSAEWNRVAAGVAAWQRNMAPVWIISVALVAVAALLAAWLSGVLPSPAWFRSVNAFWWRLWP
jgi:hypothetical protein